MEIHRWPILAFLVTTAPVSHDPNTNQLIFVHAVAPSLDGTTDLELADDERVVWCLPGAGAMQVDVVLPWGEHSELGWSRPDDGVDWIAEAWSRLTYRTSLAHKDLQEERWCPAKRHVS